MVLCATLLFTMCNDLRILNGDATFPDDRWRVWAVKRSGLTFQTFVLIESGGVGGMRHSWAIAKHYGGFASSLLLRLYVRLDRRIIHFCNLKESSDGNRIERIELVLW